MELVRGKPLSTQVEDSGKIDEPRCQVIMRQIMRAILYFNSRNIVHRDLKLDNVMIEGLDTGKIEDIRVKLIDFGVSKFTNSEGQKIDLRTYCGTLNFMAPEVIQGKSYDISCDLWSVGVIAFFILSGRPPFIGKDEHELIKKISSCNYDFEDEIWCQISKPAKTWIRSMLKVNPSERMTPEAALSHEWLSSPASAQFNYPIHPKVLISLHGCHHVHDLHFQLINVFTQYLFDKELKEIRETFQSIDRDHSGSIDVSELIDAF